MSLISPTDVTPSPSETLNLADLVGWRRASPSLAVFGHPVAHSVSPEMHNAALGQLGLEHPTIGEWTYFKFDIEPAQLPEALPLLLERKFHGVNLTVPLKMHAVALIAEVEEEARAMGAVNTLLARKEGGWRGYNTDGYGLSQALRRELGVDLASATVVLLGAGGGARGAAVQCLREGCAALWIGNRSADNLHALLEQLRPLDGEKRVRGFDLASPPFKDWPRNAVIINATTSGMHEGDVSPIDVALLGDEVCAFDMIYRRVGTTPLVAAVRARGLRAADGLGMLVWQGARSLEIWTGVPAPAQAMMNAACRALGLPPRHA